jgi:hypothetical protein
MMIRTLGFSVNVKIDQLTWFCQMPIMGIPNSVNRQIVKYKYILYTQNLCQPAQIME